MFENIMYLFKISKVFLGCELKGVGLLEKMFFEYFVRNSKYE